MKKNGDTDECRMILREQSGHLKLTLDVSTLMRLNPTGVYVFYSCEMEDTYYGKYYVKDDTVQLYEFMTATNTLLSANSTLQSEKAKFKVVMIDDKLKHVA